MRPRQKLSTVLSTVQPTCSYNLVKKANQLWCLLGRLEWARLSASILTSFYRRVVQKQHPRPLQCGAAAVAGRLRMRW